MRDVFDTIAALVFSTGFLFGSGYVFKTVHDFVKKETLGSLLKLGKYSGPKS